MMTTNDEKINLKKFQQFSKLVLHKNLQLGYLTSIEVDEDQTWYKIHFFKDNEIIKINDTGFSKVDLIFQKDMKDFLKDHEKSVDDMQISQIPVFVDKSTGIYFQYQKINFVLDKYLQKFNLKDNQLKVYFMQDSSNNVSRYRYFMFFDHNFRLIDTFEFNPFRLTNITIIDNNLDLFDYLHERRGFYEQLLEEADVLKIKSKTYKFKEYLEANDLSSDKVFVRVYTSENRAIELLDLDSNLTLFRIHLIKGYYPYQVPKTEKVFNILDIQQSVKSGVKAPKVDEEDIEDKEEPEEQTEAIIKETVTRQSKDNNTDLEIRKWGNNDAVVHNDVIYFLNAYLQDVNLEKDELISRFNDDKSQIEFINGNTNELLNTIPIVNNFPKGLEKSKTVSIYEYICSQRGYKEYTISAKTGQLGVNRITYRFKSWIDHMGLKIGKMKVRLFYRLEGKKYRYQKMEIYHDGSLITTLDLESDGRPKHAKKDKNSFIIKNLIKK